MVSQHAHDFTTELNRDMMTHPAGNGSSGDGGGALVEEAAVGLEGGGLAHPKRQPLLGNPQGCRVRQPAPQVGPRPVGGQARDVPQDGPLQPLALALGVPTSHAQQG